MTLLGSMIRLSVNAMRISLAATLPLDSAVMLAFFSTMSRADTDSNVGSDVLGSATAASLRIDSIPPLERVIVFAAETSTLPV